MIRSFKPNLLISRNRTMLPFLNIIPASYPWLARRCSYFRSRMAIKVFHNSFMHCSKDLSNIWYENSTQRENKINQIIRFHRSINKMKLTGFVLTDSGGCSCPDIHFHKSGFSCTARIFWSDSSQ